MFEVDLPLLWVDFEARLLVGMYPLAWLPGWQACASQLLGVYRRNLGADAPSIARPLGRDFRVWCVFGLGGLREALLCADHDLDRRALEALKWHLIHAQHLEVSPAAWPVLVRVEPDVLILRGADAAEVAEFTLSREALADIAAEPSPWAPILEAAGQDPFVHGLRGLLVGDAPLPPLHGADLTPAERRHRTDDSG